MLVAYLDESYTDDRYYIAAFVIDEADLPLLEEARRRMEDYVVGFGVDPSTEIHAHSLMTGRDGWEPVAKQVRSRIQIYSKWVSELAKLPGVMVVRGVDIPRLHARYRYPQPPHQIVLQHTLEAIDKYAEKQGKQVRIIADVVPGQVEHAADFLRYKANGTPGYKSSSLPRVVPPLEFQDSALVPGLQAADGIAYIYRRFDAHIETDARVERAVAKIWATLNPLWFEVWRWDP